MPGNGSRTDDGTESIIEGARTGPGPRMGQLSGGRRLGGCWAIWRPQRLPRAPSTVVRAMASGSTCREGTIRGSRPAPRILTRTPSSSESPSAGYLTKPCPTSSHFVSLPGPAGVRTRHVMPQRHSTRRGHTATPDGQVPAPPDRCSPPTERIEHQLTRVARLLDHHLQQSHRFLGRVVPPRHHARQAQHIAEVAPVSLSMSFLRNRIHSRWER